MRKFDVSLFCFDDPTEDHFDSLSIPLTRLFNGVVEATNEKSAAARTRIDNVGTHRWEKLDRLNAPDPIRSRQVDVNAIKAQLIRTSIWIEGIGYLLDNGIEAWLINVNEFSEDEYEQS